MSDPSAQHFWCTHDGRADFWLTPEPGMGDAQKGGLLLVSLFRGLSRAMEGQPLGGIGCDISEDSILAIAGRARGIAVGPTVYAQDACAAPRSPFGACHRLSTRG